MKAISLVIVITSLFIMILVSCAYAMGIPREGFENANASTTASTMKTTTPIVCLPNKKCDWALDQVKGLIYEEPRFMQAIGIEPSDLLSFQNKILEYAIATLRVKPDWILFFDKPNFQGKIFVLPRKALEWKYGSDKVSSELETFIRDFQIYYGRKFSVMIPAANTKITIEPIQGGSYPGEPLVLSSGFYESVDYFKGPVNSFTIEV